VPPKTNQPTKQKNSVPWVNLMYTKITPPRRFLWAEVTLNKTVLNFKIKRFPYLKCKTEKFSGHFFSCSSKYLQNWHQLSYLCVLEALSISQETNIDSYWSWQLFRNSLADKIYSVINKILYMCVKNKMCI
jgi:hypothetical protein